MDHVTDAVILARGLGKRMRAAGSTVDAQTDAVANTGVKALIPIGRPFLDYVLHDLAEAGMKHITLVIGPEHQELRQYYSTLKTHRITIGFAIQERPQGTADAVLAAEKAVGTRRFIVINSDNTYPVPALKALAAVPNSGLVGFRTSGLITGNIPRERVERFAAIVDDGSGHLARIIEKPSANDLAVLGNDPRISMNCWCFDQRIFSACRSISLSPRGELELPDAVSAAMRAGVRFTIVDSQEPVLDMSCRDDIASVKAALEHRAVSL